LTDPTVKFYMDGPGSTQFVRNLQCDKQHQIYFWRALFSEL